jgi:hypothetical protein
MEMETLVIETAWMIPTTDIPTVATNRPNKYVLAPKGLIPHPRSLRPMAFTGSLS